MRFQVACETVEDCVPRVHLRNCNSVRRLGGQREATWLTTTIQMMALKMFTRRQIFLSYPWRIAGKSELVRKRHILFVKSNKAAYKRYSHCLSLLYKSI